MHIEFTRVPLLKLFIPTEYTLNVPLCGLYKQIVLNIRMSMYSTEYVHINISITQGIILAIQD